MATVVFFNEAEAVDAEAEDTEAYPDPEKAPKAGSAKTRGRSVSGLPVVVIEHSSGRS